MGTPTPHQRHLPCPSPPPTRNTPPPAPSPTRRPIRATLLHTHAPTNHPVITTPADTHKFTSTPNPPPSGDNILAPHQDMTEDADPLLLHQGSLEDLTLATPHTQRNKKGW